MFDFQNTAQVASKPGRPDKHEEVHSPAPSMDEGKFDGDLVRQLLEAHFCLAYLEPWSRGV